jgi:peptide/nickel transport system substrate-binding protein
MGKVKVKFSKLFLVLNTLALFIQCNVDNHDNLTVFRYNEAASVSTLDPTFVKSQSENWIVTQINAGLIQLDTLLYPSERSCGALWQGL